VPGASAGGGGALPPVRLGGFLDEGLEGLLPSRRGDTAREYDWFGSIQGRALATDNFRNSTDRREAELVGTLRPTIGVLADSARLTGQLRYSPGFSVFAGETNQPARLDHRFVGNGTAVIVPDRVFLNARAFGSLIPVLPGNLDTETPLPRREFTQSYTFTASPYAVQRFGTLATAIAGYTISHNIRDGQTVRLTPNTAPIFRSSDLTTHTGYAGLRTGEDFGRFAAEARVRGTTFVGGGPVTDGGHRALALLETRYSITRTVAGLVEGGYESLRFGGTRPLRVDAPVWGVGVRLDPGPNTVVIARYRRRDGFDSPQLDARTSLGPRTTLFAGYFERLGTGLLRQSDLLNSVSVDELGNPVDSRTGEPVADLGNSSITGAAGQNSLNRVRRGNIGVTHFLGRDTITLRYAYDRQNPVSADPNTLALSRESHTGSVIYQRPLSPQTTLIGIAQAGQFELANIGSRGNTYLGRALVRHLFNERLVGTLQYQLTYRTTETDRGGISTGPRDSIQNTIIATLTQAF